MSNIFYYKDPDQQREYQRKWIKARRASFFNGKSCVKCNSTESLELDHIDPATKEHHLIWSWSQERREAEIKKCQVLCRACHIEKTRKENQKTHCIRGHVFDEKNTTSGSNGTKRCKTCHRDGQRVRAQAKRKQKVKV